ncbi:MarR family transcriptional regulator [Vibrio chagasii]|uniref:MarR family transcriptional regulator n=1 Tax=Vibrio chagasii TaxID=170679 RepID=UPI0022834EAC|nr:helix-turn-helix domain-containing protein [Vibrio chagasii]MCY9828809.1 helix-turn-helix domain-containing protein [Vibrio chagasii]
MNNGLHINDALLKGKYLEAQVLSFLHQEIFSNFDNLIALIKIQQPNLSRLLKRMTSKGLLEKHSLTLDTCKVSLWGITDKGIHAVGDHEHAPLHCFHPSRISLVTLNHTLMNQRVYIALKHLNWTEWINADRKVFKQKFPVPHRPDAIVRTPKGTITAIETELTLKTPLRYRAIMKSHIQAKEKGFWKHVIYVVRDEEYKKMLKRRFDHIKYIQFDESRHPFEKYRKMVSIFTLDEVSKLTQS